MKRGTGGKGLAERLHPHGFYSRKLHPKVPKVRFSRSFRPAIGWTHSSRPWKGIEPMRLGVNLFIQIVNHQDRGWQRAVPTIRSQSYRFLTKVPRRFGCPPSH